MTNIETEQLDLNNIPCHVAIIMDGNGRWAKQRGEVRTMGHKAGAENVHSVASEAARLGVKFLTLYTFSKENWNRPQDEISALMGLLFSQIDKEIFQKNNIRFMTIGDMEQLPEYVRRKLNSCIEATASNTGMTLTLALSYSSKWEITEATKQIASLVKAGMLNVDDITCDTVAQHLCTHNIPDPDLLIRTGCEVRISNFLLWQCAYSELYFCDVFWPDFNEEELKKAIAEFQKRERRFGKTSEQIENDL